MKAIRIKEYGGPEQLVIAEEATPQPGAGQLLIKVHATALNRADILQRKGHYPPPPGASEIPGLEMAGEVVATGPDCKEFSKGDRVFALLAGGGYAQYVCIPEDHALPIPEEMSYSDAAAIAEVFLTAWQALHWLGEIQADEHVLIHAGASGVGTAAIQLAREAGCKIAVTASTAEKLAFCKQLGAQQSINYTSEDFATVVKDWTKGKGANCVIDFIGAPYARQHLDCLAKDARWIVLAFMGGAKTEDFHFGKILQKRIQLKGSTLRARSDAYKASLASDFRRKALPLFEAGKLKPVVYKTYPWEQVADAHRLMERNENIGKIVLHVSHD